MAVYFHIARGFCGPNSGWNQSSTQNQSLD